MRDAKRLIENTAKTGLCVVHGVRAYIGEAMATMRRSGLGGPRTSVCREHNGQDPRERFCGATDVIM